MLTRGPYAHDVDGPWGRGPYAHAIPTLEAVTALLEVTIDYAGLAPLNLDWGDTNGAFITNNTGSAVHTYVAGGTYIITLTDAVGNVATQTVTVA